MADLSGFMVKAQRLMAMRYIGTFKAETDSYGFLMEPRDVAGCKPELPRINGGSEIGGIFVHASMIRRCLKAKSLMLKEIDGNKYSFDIGNSMTHNGKKEAFGLRPVNPMTV